MRTHRYAIIFGLSTVGLVVWQVILGYALSGAVVFLAVCVATGVTVGVAIRRNVRK